MSQEWYYAKDDQKHGPCTSAELKALARSGALVAADLVWTEGMKDWQPAGSIKGLITPMPPTPPPLKPKAPEALATFESVDDLNNVEATTIPRQPWYCHWAFLAVTTLIFFPITLVLVWWKSNYSKKAKWAWTGACWLVLIAIANAPKEPDKRKAQKVTASVTTPHQTEPQPAGTPVARTKAEVEADLSVEKLKQLLPKLSDKAQQAVAQFVKSSSAEGLRTYYIGEHNLINHYYVSIDDSNVIRRIAVTQWDNLMECSVPAEKKFDLVPPGSSANPPKNEVLLSVRLVSPSDEPDARQNEVYTSWDLKKIQTTAINNSPSFIQTIHSAEIVAFDFTKLTCRAKGTLLAFETIDTGSVTNNPSRVFNDTTPPAALQAYRQLPMILVSP